VRALSRRRDDPLGQGMGRTGRDRLARGVSSSTVKDTTRKRLQWQAPTFLGLVTAACLAVGIPLNSDALKAVSVFSGAFTLFLVLDYFGLLADPILRPRDPAVDRVKRLVKALAEATEVMAAIEKEVTARRVMAERLQRDVETHTRLLALDREEVEAVAQTMAGEVRREGRRNLLTSFLLNAFFFGLGVLVTLLLS
jgi:hypothetical protein